MYDVDDEDEVEELASAPKSSHGAPSPFIISDERRVVLGYYVHDDTDWESDERPVRVVGPTDALEPFALVRFAPCYAHMFGPPNDEAFEGHPLASRGVRPCGAYEVRHSSWVRRLERMNAVHPHHRPEAFENHRHLIFAFHDSTFDCICEAFDIRLGHGSPVAAIPEMVKLLGWDRR